MRISLDELLKGFRGRKIQIYGHNFDTKHDEIMLSKLRHQIDVLEFRVEMNRLILITTAEHYDENLDRIETSTEPDEN